MLIKDLNSLFDHSYNWTTHIVEIDGIPFLEKCKSNLRTIIESNEYENLLIVKWAYATKEACLLPDLNQIDLLYFIENELISLLENDWQSILYYACMGDGKKEWRFYSKDITETLNRIKKSLGEHSFYGDFSFKTEKDPEWNDYYNINQILSDCLK